MYARIRTILIIILVVTLLGNILYSRKLRTKAKSLIANQETLLDSIKHFKVADSLNTIMIGNLELSLKQYKKYHSDDATLISELKSQKPKAIMNTETRTEYSIKTELKDTIIYKDTIKTILYNSKWNCVKGFVAKDTISLNIKNREELLITECLQKKKFLFFKLPISIFGYKKKTLNIISKNPNTQIISSEYITIK